MNREEISDKQTEEGRVGRREKVDGRRRKAKNKKRD